MVQSNVFKTQIVLSDYPYRRDIEHRVLISHLSVLEVEILHEILHHSLIISIDLLADHLGVKADRLIPTLDHLSKTKLFKRDGSKIIVDKEVRKFYESHLEKFDDDFEPNFEFLQSLLSKVPLPVILNWYPIPRTSNNIFSSLIEQCFSTPTTYRQYLSELRFADKVLDKIVVDLYKSPTHKLCAKELMKKYDLTREKFEECVLLLEYHLVACLTYTRVDNEWEEFITLFSEWMDYLDFEAKSRPEPIKNQSAVNSNCPTECGFVKDLVAVLQSLQSKKAVSLSIKDAAWLEILKNKLIQVEFAEPGQKGALVPTEKGLLWLRKSLNDQVMALSLDPLNILTSSEAEELLNPRNLRLIEKSLKRLTPNQWVYLDNFLEGFSTPIGNKEQIKLQKKGARWKYLLPEYTQKEIDFVKSTIMERFFELGIVMTGKHNNKPCFCLTTFGQHFIS